MQRVVTSRKEPNYRNEELAHLGSTRARVGNDRVAAEAVNDKGDVKNEDGLMRMENAKCKMQRMTTQYMAVVHPAAVAQKPHAPEMSAPGVRFGSVCLSGRSRWGALAGRLWALGGGGLWVGGSGWEALAGRLWLGGSGWEALGDSGLWALYTLNPTWMLVDMPTQLCTPAFLADTTRHAHQAKRDAHMSAQVESGVH
ncbi:hypothetical protein E4U21_002906 [Claviceps maximensis]|nr:hypothetical protein E4U21_002906 [Claviceps maximensis]